MSEYKGYIACDFDGVLSQYIRPYKYDKLGKPNRSMIRTLNYFRNQGYYITIFTCRQCTPNLINWLNKNNVCYNSVNYIPKHYDMASDKLLYDIIIDDKSVNYHWKHNNKCMDDLIDEIEMKLRWGKEGK